MNILKSIHAWFSGLFCKEAKPMNVTASSLALIAGTTAQLTSGEPANYTSSDTSILTVDSLGVVTAVAAGVATISAVSVANPSASDAVVLIDFTVTADAPAAQVEDTVTTTVAANPLAPSTQPAADMTITATASAPVDSVVVSGTIDYDDVDAKAHKLATQTDLEKLEAFIEKMGLTTLKEVRAAIKFLKALA